MSLMRALCVGVIVGASSLGAAAQTNPLEPAEDLMAGPRDGPWRRLFLDAMVVEEQEGLQRVFHAAEKHPGNPIIPAERPWEQMGPYPGPDIYGSVLWDEGKLRMWYRCYTPTQLVCYAESLDGIHWTKPNLGVCQLGGSTENNIVLGVAPDPDPDAPYQGASQCNFPLVFKRPWASDPEKRYVLFCYALDYRKHRAAYSSDGLHWTFAPETKQTGLFPGGDATNYGWDPYSERYFGMRKMAAYGLGGRRESGRGRAVGIAWSDPDDELHWTIPVDAPVLAPDDLDPDATQFYNAPAFAYQGLFISQLWVFHARWFKYGKYTDERMQEAEGGSPATTDVQLAWSWDLINWTRTPERQPFIALGDAAAGDFDCGSVHTAQAPVVVGDRLYFYYSGAQGRYLKPRHQAIGLATLRLDGFCSMRAGDQEGWLISRREPLEHPRVTINARTDEGGYVVAEILDRDNQVLDGFSRDECIPFSGDDVRGGLRWQKDQFDETQREGDKKIRFYLRRADLYSYLP